MKLSEHVESIRKMIDLAFRNRLGRMGVTAFGMQPVDTISPEDMDDRRRINEIYLVLLAETGSAADAYEKLVEEFTFTLFNRIAAMVVMESHTLHPEIITRRSQHGDRSFAHVLWLEQYPEGRNEEQEGLLRFMENQLEALSADIPLFSLHHPYHLSPTSIELNGIMNAFNQVANDAQVEPDIWQSDDVLGWLYESYNNFKKAAHKASGDKTEYNKVSIQSQVYTPRWVVKFLVDNSLGKLYLEMYPDSDIKNRYKIANAPKMQSRQPKPLTEIRLIDPATGSGNFLLYGFDLFYDLYVDQIENYGADYDERKIPELILQKNLHGVDIDDRAIQLAQLGLYIKAKRRRRSVKVDHFNVVSSDFFLPEFDEVKHLFDNGEKLNPELVKIVTNIWTDLKKAHKFGSLLRIEETFNQKLRELKDREIREAGMFVAETIASLDQFRETFFANLQTAVIHNAEQQGLTFLNTKTYDAITFLELLTKKYDIAVTNPPYTDSSDFGPELKSFVDANFRHPFKFNANLYATFICRCAELIDDEGKMALIHPHTLMFIKTFEEVRKFMIQHTHIDIMVDYGLDRVNLFGPGILLDATWYVLSKNKCGDSGIYLSITSNQQEKTKMSSFEQANEDACNNRKNDRVYLVDQSKLKIIEGWPFIYWISDGFREKFKEKNLGKFADVRAGIQTSNNDRFLRYWWEVEKGNIIDDKNCDRGRKRWVLYSKGGPFKKWYGNIWCVVDWKNNGSDLQEYLQSVGQDLHAQDYYFREGLTYSAAGSKGISFRYLPDNCLFSTGGPSIFVNNQTLDLYFLLAFLNTKLAFYIAECLNPTVNKNPGDLRRIVFILPSRELHQSVSKMAEANVNINKQLCSFHIEETNFETTVIASYYETILKDRLLNFVNFENAQLTLVLINEAIVNRIIYEVYDLSPEDRTQVEVMTGKSIGEMPVLIEAREAYLSSTTIDNETAKESIQNLGVASFSAQQVQVIVGEFPALYQSNNDLEEFCIRHQVNPINVWYWFRESKVLPQGRAAEIALEFITDACRSILMEDDDGIIMLTGLPGEPRLLDRLEQHCLAQGFTSAQFSQLDGLLGRPLEEYLEYNFFMNLSDHLNLFMYLPKTPFIWHLSSGVQQGFEAYIIIYKWNRDSLYKLKSKYLGKRAENLEYRQVELADSNTAQAQAEKERIRMQLQEIAEFTRKIAELIAEGYDPKLNDGVGKNIAPLQKKGLLRYDVLNAKQLDKYLKADW